MNKIKAALAAAGMLFFCAAAMAQNACVDEDWSFERARAYMRQLPANQGAFTASITGGVAVSGVAMAKLIDRVLTPSDIVKEVSKLRAPLLARTPASKRFVQERALLKEEAKAVEGLRRRAAENLDRWMEWEDYAYRYRWGSWAEMRLDKLDEQYCKAYDYYIDQNEALASNLKEYKRAYKVYKRTGRMTLGEGGARQTVTSTVVRKGTRQFCKNMKKKVPLFILFAWALSSSDKQEAVFAGRLLENPVLAAQLCEQDQAAVGNSKTLSEIYIQIARVLHALSSLDPEEAKEMARQVSEENAREAARRFFRRELKHAFAS